MGFVTNLYDFDSFIYHVSFSNGLIEHEFDHVLVNDQIDEAVDNVVQCIQENLNETNQSSKVAQALESFFETN